MTTEYSPSEPFVVKTEEDAWSLLDRLIKGSVTFSSFRALRFDSWPVFSTYIDEDRLDSALTPYMMEGFIDLQRAIYRSHALLAHEAGNARLLSDLEKNQLELVVEVREGSSDSSIDLQEVLTQIGMALVNKMDATSIVITVLGLALIYAGSSAWRAYLQNARDEKLAESQNKQVTAALEALQFSQQKDVERMEIFAKAMKKEPALAVVKEDADEAKHSLTRHLTKDTDASINGIEIPQDAGQRLTRNSRTNSIDVRLDGVYRINRVDTTSADGFRVRLEGVADGVEFEAGVQDALISEKQRSVLQQAEWDKVPVKAQINAKKKNDDIFDAVVVEVEPYRGSAKGRRSLAAKPATAKRDVKAPKDKAKN